VADTDRYKEAGVDLAAAEDAKDRILKAVSGARSALAVGDVGAFGGMVRLPADVPEPVLVTSTDGVGTKVLVAIQAGRHDTIGEDLVNHCVDDILVHGARPIAFLDYIAAASIDPESVANLVEGVARGCRAHDMTLAGGETAELPDLYHEGHYDLAGTIVGVVSESKALHADAVKPGDVLLGYASNGLHTNGYTLARHIVFTQQGLDVDSQLEDFGTVGDAFLAVHRSYASAVFPAIPLFHSLAHITGGGIPGNLSRALPDGCGAVISTSTWQIPHLFSYLQNAGDVSRSEMFDVFNMGIGMIAALPSDAVAEAQRVAKEAGVETWTIGEVVAGAGVTID
jgi:phosphoribosylformylglycinamidine cyclo-ligase